jgi:hypothetical protein
LGKQTTTSLNGLQIGRLLTRPFVDRRYLHHMVVADSSACISDTAMNRDITACLPLVTVN